MLCVHLLLLYWRYPFSAFASEEHSFHVLCIQMLTDQRKITILHSALKAAQSLMGEEMEFVQPSPCRSLPFCKHTQAGKFNSQEPSSASLLQTQLYPPFLMGHPQGSFMAVIAHFARNILFIMPALSLSSQYPSRRALFLQPAPSLFHFFLLLQKPNSLWLSASAGGISFSVMEELLSSLMDVHQNRIKWAWCPTAHRGVWFQGKLLPLRLEFGWVEKLSRWEKTVLHQI